MNCLANGERSQLAGSSMYFNEIYHTRASLQSDRVSVVSLPERGERGLMVTAMGKEWRQLLYTEVYCAVQILSENRLRL